MPDVTDPGLTDRRIKEWFLLEKARRKEESKPAVVSSVLPVITISRQFGAGGHSVAQMVAEALGENWQIWDKEVIEAVARSARVREEMVEVLDERTQSWIREIIGSLLNVRMLEPQAYRHHLGEALLAVAQQGYKIIVGRGANFLLPDALNVRLCASLEHRTQATMRRENIPHEEAYRQVHQVDRDRAEFTRSMFGRDINDPAFYDMVLQTDGLGLAATSAAIVAAARTCLFGEKVGS